MRQCLTQARVRFQIAHCARRKDSRPFPIPDASIAELHALVTQTVKELGKVLSIRRQKVLVSEAPRATGIVFGLSADHFQNALRELLVNAMKFSNEGAVIYVLLGIRGGSITLSVMNPAAHVGDFFGIPEEFSRIIFEPFFRLTRSVHEDYPTLDFGLGLPYAGKIISAHNGRIEVCMLKDFQAAAESEMVSFEVHLPIRNSEAAVHG